MTVASIPIWSAETRSISFACCATPRKKFPPPTTMAICTPSLCTSPISPATSWIRAVSTPKPWFAARASPDNLSKIRLKAGVLVMKDSFVPLFFRTAGSAPTFASTLAPYSTTSKKGAPRGALELFAFGLRRLGDCDGLAGVTHLEPGKPPDGDVLAQLPDLRRDQLSDRDGLIFDERLLGQAHFLVELLHLARNHFLGVELLETLHRLLHR